MIKFEAITPDMDKMKQEALDALAEQIAEKFKCPTHGKRPTIKLKMTGDKILPEQVKACCDEWAGEVKRAIESAD